VSDSNGAQTALASPGPDSCDGAQNDGERLTDGATNRAVQIYAADGKFQPPCLAVKVGGAVLRGVRRSAHAPAAKRRRSGAVRSRNRIRNARGYRAQPPARGQRPAHAGLSADLALAPSRL